MVGKRVERVPIYNHDRKDIPPTGVLGWSIPLSASVSPRRQTQPIWFPCIAPQCNAVSSSCATPPDVEHKEISVSMNDQNADNATLASGANLTIPRVKHNIVINNAKWIGREFCICQKRWCSVQCMLSTKMLLWLEQLRLGCPAFSFFIKQWQPTYLCE